MRATDRREERYGSIRYVTSLKEAGVSERSRDVSLEWEFMSPPWSLTQVPPGPSLQCWLWVGILCPLVLGKLISFSMFLLSCLPLPLLLQSLSFRPSLISSNSYRPLRVWPCPTNPSYVLFRFCPQVAITSWLPAIWRQYSSAQLERLPNRAAVPFASLTFHTLQGMFCCPHREMYGAPVISVSLGPMFSLLLTFMKQKIKGCVDYSYLPFICWILTLG